MEGISEDIVLWLSGDEDPIIRGLVIREFPDFVKGNIHDITLSPKVAGIIGRGNGPAGETSRYDLWYHGTVWAFAELVTYGLTIDNPTVFSSARYIIDRAQMTSGGFTMAWVPPFEAAGWTGEILFYLLSSGYRGKETDLAAEWLLSHQQKDGGWNFSPLRGVKDSLMYLLFGHSGKIHSFERESSLLSTVSCGRALALYSKITGGKINAVKKAAEFVLNRKRLLRKSQKGGELYLSNSHFHSLGYPILCQQDILSSLLFIAEAGMINDDRASEPFNVVMRARLEDGRFASGIRTHGTLQAKYRFKTGVPDKWVTLQAMRLMKYITW